VLKRRIIPMQLYHSGRLVKTREFTAARDVGDPIKSSKVYSDQDADELMLLNIDPRGGSIHELVDVVRRISEQSYVPLTVGGGIRHIKDAEMLFEIGADKVLINSMAYSDAALISSIAKRYGRQAVVIGIDVRLDNNRYILFSEGGCKREEKTLDDHIASVIDAGAGEIMIQCINRDGVMEGYDINLLHQVIGFSQVPIIAAAGAGNFFHLKEALEAGVDAVACGSLFNFGDNSPLRAKAFLKNYGIPLKKV
jgi:cyclase